MLKLIVVLLCGQEPRPAESITVNVESPKPVTLYEVVDKKLLLEEDVVMDTLVTTTIARPACIAPCVVTVPRGKEYFVAAPGMPRSVSFALGGEAERTTLKVSPGDATLRMLAKATIVVSVLLLGGGILALASGLSSGGTSGVVQTAVGGTGLALGVGVCITGILLWLGPAATRVLIE